MTEQGETYDEKTLMIVATETNIRTQLKQHPNPQQFIKTLQNEAIDNAFQETSERIGNLEKKFSELDRGTESGFLETAKTQAHQQGEIKEIKRDLEELRRRVSLAF